MPQKRKHSECAGSTSKRIKYGATQLSDKRVSALTSRWGKSKVRSNRTPGTTSCVVTGVKRKRSTLDRGGEEISTKQKSVVQRTVDPSSITHLDCPSRPLLHVPIQPACVSKNKDQRQVRRWAKHKEIHLAPLSEASTDTWDEYRYSPITTGQIRLMILQPESFDQRIRCDLITVDTRTAPPYEALSYTWGDPTPVTTILISNQQLETPYSHRWRAGSSKSSRLERQHLKRSPIRSNLYQALKSLRLPDQARYLWIDAICIDQSNLQERNQQVQVMGEIYSNARNVCVWLGNDEAQLEPSNECNHFMADIAMETISDILDRSKYENMLADNTQMWKWVGFLNLMNRSWFRRAWIVQEIALAKKATIYCGTHTVDWMEFQDAVALFSKSFDVLQPKLRAHFVEIQSDTKHWTTHPDFDIRRLAATRMVDALSAFRKKDDGSLDRTKDLETLLCLFQDSVCSDPRDRVYALLGLATDGDAITVDYSKSVLQIYQEVVEHSVRATQSLDILCRPWATSSTNIQSGSVSLPSWIIAHGDRSDFPSQISGQFTSRAASETFVGIGEMVPYSACGHGRHSKAPAVDFPGTTILHGKIIQSNHLFVRGIAIGRISFCTEPMADRIIPRVCFEKLGGACNKSSKGKAKVPDRLWRTLVADRGPGNTPCPPWYRPSAQHCLDDRLCNGHLNIDRAIYSVTTYGADFLKRVRSVIYNRVFFEATPTSYQHTKTTETLVGLGMNGTREGDILAVLYGCSVPVVLRPVHKANRLNEYQLIGEAFVYGRMEGETFHTNYRAKTFRIV